MPAFTIDADNNITAFASSKQIEGTGGKIESFSSPHELAALAVKWPGARLVEIWNSLPDVEPVQRFTSRQVAATRLWKAIQQLKPANGVQARQLKAKKGGAGNKAQSGAPSAPRPNSKTAEVIALLHRPQGVTLVTLMQKTGWQAHSVRGFISGQLGKKMGLRVGSFKRDQQRVYAIKH